MALTLLASLTGCATDSRNDEPLGGEAGNTSGGTSGGGTTTSGTGTGGTSTGGTGTGGTGTGGTGTGGTGGTGTGGTTSSTGFALCGSELCLDLSDPANAALQNVDGARVITFDGMRMLIIRIEDARFLALSAVCTHSGCTVRYAPATTDIQCPCHGSSFALDGGVTNGPAQSPLDTYATTYDSTANVVRVMLS